MKIEKTLKKWKILKKDFAPYAGYDTVKGLTEAIKNEKRQNALKHSLIMYILENKGINIDRLIDLVDAALPSYDRDDIKVVETTKEHHPKHSRATEELASG